jgi:nucleotide-binding universal stress UspA family protein
MRKILIALDGSKGSESVLPYVETLLRNIDANVTVATVTAEGTPRQEKGAQAYLSQVAARLARKGAFVDTKVLRGRPAAELVRLAAEEAYDLLALCSRGKKGLKRMVLGSVAEEVLRHTSVPVLVVHPREEGAPDVAIRKIAVPLDGSHRSAAVLPPLTEFARALGAKVEFVSVVSPTKRETLPVETVAHNIFQEQRMLQEKGLSVELSILYGDPAQEILAFARGRQADLVAIATHGRSGLKRTFYGSVAEKILRNGTLPLLVVRNEAVVREHPVHAQGGKARRRALATLKSVGDLTRTPYPG